MRTETANFFAELFGKTKGAAVQGDPSIGAEPMILNTTKETEQTQQIDYTAPSKDRGFAKKLRWAIEGSKSLAEKWTITPEIAGEILSTWNDRNRPMSKGLVSQYAGSIAAGRWKFTGEPIIFSSVRLIDGQHRLAACVHAGVAIEALVVFGAPDDAFPFIDVGKTRAASDVFAINGVKNAKLMAAAIQWVIGYERNILGTASTGHMLTRMDREELYQAYLGHEKLQDSAWVGSLFAPTRLASPSTIVAIHYLAARKSKKEADEFFRKVAEGLGFGGKKDPAYRLYQRLIDTATSQEKLGRKQLAALVIKAWNANRLGRDVGTLKYSPDETFPKVI